MEYFIQKNYSYQKIMKQKFNEAKVYYLWFNDIKVLHFF